MIRRLLPSVLCIFLSPLLVAQQAGQTIANPVLATPSQASSATPTSAAVTIPKGTKIEIVSLVDVSSEFAVAGSPVRFAVAKDIVVNGVKAIHAGAPVTGTISEVKRGAAQHQWASLTIRVKEMRVAHRVRLRLTTFDPGIGSAAGDLAMCVLLFPVCLALEKCGEDGCSKAKDSDGQQALLPRCVSERFWVRSAVTISSAELDNERAAASAYPAISCARIIDRGTIFGQPGISFVEFQ